MCFHVFPQGLSLIETLSTLLTHMTSSVFMNCHVILQLVGNGKFPATKLTLELKLGRIMLDFVHCQLGVIVETGTTNIANEILLTGVSVHVFL